MTDPGPKTDGVLSVEPIAFVRSDFPVKFGIPRQSGLVPELTADVVFEKEYSAREAFRGLEGFSHIWLIWGFSRAPRGEWSPTVRPPRLGGDARVGVFATRSPVRPNPLAISAVRLIKVGFDAEQRAVLTVGGADLLDGTPVYDVKPYVPYADRIDATDGFAAPPEPALEVDAGPAAGALPPDKLAALVGILARDPRPAYQNDPDRVYSFEFAGAHIEFVVREGKAEVISAAPQA